MTINAKTKVKLVRLPMAAGQILSLLAGVKDVTRRPVRKPVEFVGSGQARWGNNWTAPSLWGMLDKVGDIITLGPAEAGDEHVMHHRYGAPGDRAVITEAWRVIYDGETGEAAVEYRADNVIRVITDEEAAFKIARAWTIGRRYWRPGRFMPNWASRITREVISVTPQRLHTITVDDVAREGVGWETADRGIFDGAIDYFSACWNGIYGESHPWDVDPWIRRVEFTREAPTEAQNGNDH